MNIVTISMFENPDGRPLTGPVHGIPFAALCKKYHVRRMVIFGSAVRSDFDVRTSDIDIQVSFEQMSPALHADAYFGLLEELETIFGRSVDLLEEQAIDNPYLKKTIETTGVLVYASA